MCISLFGIPNNRGKALLMLLLFFAVAFPPFCLVFCRMDVNLLLIFCFISSWRIFTLVCSRMRTCAPTLWKSKKKKTITFIHSICTIPLWHKAYEKTAYLNRADKTNSNCRKWRERARERERIRKTMRHLCQRTTFHTCGRHSILEKQQKIKWRVDIYWNVDFYCARFYCVDVEQKNHFQKWEEKRKILKKETCNK